MKRGSDNTVLLGSKPYCALQNKLGLANRVPEQVTHAKHHCVRGTDGRRRFKINLAHQELLQLPIPEMKRAAIMSSNGTASAARASTTAKTHRAKMENI